MSVVLSVCRVYRWILPSDFMYLYISRYYWIILKIHLAIICITVMVITPSTRVSFLRISSSPGSPLQLLLSWRAGVGGTSLASHPVASHLHDCSWRQWQMFSVFCSPPGPWFRHRQYKPSSLVKTTSFSTRCASSATWQLCDLGRLLNRFHLKANIELLVCTRHYRCSIEQRSTCPWNLHSHGERLTINKYASLWWMLWK